MSADSGDFQRLNYYYGHNAFSFLFQVPCSNTRVGLLGFFRIFRLPL